MINVEQIQAAADYAQKIQEVYRTKNGTIIFGSKGLVQSQLSMQPDRVTKLGVVYPSGFPIPDETDEVILNRV